MELLIVLLIAAGLVFLLYKTFLKDDSVSTTSTNNEHINSNTMINKDATVTENVLDINKDGKVDMKDAVEVVKKTRTRVKKALDKDGDGKVTVKDVKVVASKAAAKSKEVAAKARGRKPLAK